MTLLRDTLVDLKNGLPPRALANKLHERGVVFIHVPKCAGTSFEEALRRRYRLSRIIIDPQRSFDAARHELGVPETDGHRHEILNRASAIRRTVLHYNLSMGFKCITGHAPLGPQTIAEFGHAYDFVTVLRDPVKRYISHLAHNYSDQGGHGAISMPVENFLETDRASMMGNLFGKYFSGLEIGADYSSTTAIERCKENLAAMGAVGFVDKLGAFAEDVTCLTGNRIHIGHENRTPGKSSFDLSEGVIDRIRELCRTDIELYQWACTNFRDPD